MVTKDQPHHFNSNFRAFLGIELSHHAQKYIIEIMDNLRKKLNSPNIKWTTIDKLHITLRFLGNIDFEQSKKLVESLQKNIHEFSPFSLRLSSLTALPNLKSPHVIILETHPLSPLLSLSLMINRITSALSLPNDPKPFHPHLTLARVNDKILHELKNIIFPTIVLKVNNIKLFRSDIFSEGSTYTTIAEIPLLEKD